MRQMANTVDVGVWIMIHKWVTDILEAVVGGDPCDHGGY